MDESSVDQLDGVVRSPSSPGGPPSEAVIGSAEHFRSVFERTAAAADRAMGPWLQRTMPPVFADRADPSAYASLNDMRRLRALVRAAATAYARNLKKIGVTPERMVVLVKQATRQPGTYGFGVQELTADAVLWSIEAYFDD